MLLLVGLWIGYLCSLLCQISVVRLVGTSGQLGSFGETFPRERAHSYSCPR
ncbi:hypothetical protein CORC01_10682 [Colletotrichum orchidophilum]|uniref:Uncharacterized protein n=1 Tax=Colletotrichum orchidophilum TaxID=1209926 RepID=A0A1G4AXV1_9PEZI|nr:uncharacterized protein CORC01_10682 [Colletotrichum orchidophilum]OHE93990.1 hypothetical protein CORC01_10682 [Colletotrichum orchidophilum]